MESEDILFYILDLVILIKFIFMLKRSNQVEIEFTVGYNMKWIIPSIFIAIAVIGFMRYEGTFRIVQTVVLILMAVMYYGMKNGLAKDGIVMMGSFLPYKDAKNLDVDVRECCVKFKKKNAPAALYFDNEQLDEIRLYLIKHAGLTFKKKK